MSSRRVVAAMAGACAFGLVACGSTTNSQTLATIGGTTATSLRTEGLPSTGITSVPATSSATRPTVELPTTRPPATTAPTTTAPTTTAPTTDPARVMTGRLVASIGQVVELGGGSRLVVTRVNDSRCPADVMCVSAGDLEAEIRWTDMNGEQVLQPKWSYHSAPVAVAGSDRFVTISDTADGGGAVLWILDDPCAPVEGQAPTSRC